jgi:hypothetical protein
METSLMVRITPEIKQELNEILTLAGGYFNYKTNHLIELINGDIKYRRYSQGDSGDTSESCSCNWI